MEQSNKIKYELNEISPLIASIGNRNGFKVPERYFETLVDNLIIKKNGFTTDEYFLSYSKVGSFNVSENYFTDFKNSIIEESKNKFDFEQELNISKVSSFNIPENYFENFNDILTKKLESEKIKVELINFENFSIPQNYFESNPDKFLQAAKASVQLETKVISIFNKTYFKFSAAAAVVAIIIGVTFLFKSQPSSTINNELTAQEIKCYLQNHTEEVEDLQLTEKVVKADEKKVSNNFNHNSSSTTKKIEEQDLKNYLENELDEADLNDAI